MMSILGDVYKSFSSSLCNLLHSPVTSSLLGPNILLNTMCTLDQLFVLITANDSLQIEPFFFFLLYSQSSLQLLVCRNNWHLSLNYSQMRPLHFFVGYFKLTSFFSRCASPLLCGFVLFVASPRSCVGCYISPVTIVCNIASIDRLVSVLHHCLSCFSPFP